MCRTPRLVLRPESALPRTGLLWRIQSRQEAADPEVVAVPQEEAIRVRYARGTPISTINYLTAAQMASTLLSRVLYGR